ncbi:MAG: galactokinase family protein, partial [bacterium]|nr:galactokinase family protein [bacterium]
MITNTDKSYARVELRQLTSIILAAGSGTRMRSPELHKVCFPLGGRPVIAGSVETYRSCGVDNHYIVVGSMAEQVMQAASASSANLFFCYQAEQRGTGHAAKTAAKLLSAMGYDGDVLIVAGDKVIEEAALRRLLDVFYANDSDLAFIVGRTSEFPTSGHVVYDAGKRPISIVEVFDIARMRILSTLYGITRERAVAAAEVETLALSHIKNRKKAALALGSLWDLIEEGRNITRDMFDSFFDASDFCLQIEGREIAPEVLSGAEHANLSVYLFKAPALYYALEKLASNNAQQEEYLTDAIGILAAAGCKLHSVVIDNPHHVMAFNTPEEFGEIERYYTAKANVSLHDTPQTARSVNSWLNLFAGDDASATRCLSGIYGNAHPNIMDKRNLLADMLKAHMGCFGNEEALIARAPGRVNVMGRHIDHQGGHVNMVAIDRDAYMVISARNDRQVCLHNLEEHQFPDRSFTIDEVMDGYDGNWLNFINSNAVNKRLKASYGDWANYVKAVIARFQAEFPHIPLKGMNVTLSGDIPIATGLSSSSAIVVAMAEGIIGLNSLDVTPQRLVDLCGEGEWYVGTRGGSGDHAAMKFSCKGQIVQMEFHPFTVKGNASFPEGYAFVICDSKQKARKTEGARDIFNHRVACYHLGRELVKAGYSQHDGRIDHLRDINCARLGIEYQELLDIVRRMP